MKGPEKLLLILVGVLAGVAFLNHGRFSLGTDPQGSSFNLGFSAK